MAEDAVLRWLVKRTAAAALRMGLRLCLLLGSVYVKTRVTLSRKPDEVVKTRYRQAELPNCSPKLLKFDGFCVRNLT